MERMLGSEAEMEGLVVPAAEGARRATGEAGTTRAARVGAPDPEVAAKPRRRRFTAEYRLRILKEADACKKPGELGALLRREGLYSSHLTNWRRQREQGALRDLRARRRGPTPRPVDPRVKQLEAENRRLTRKLQRAETIITLQKKVAEILGIPLKPLDNDESD
jgi:transposase